MAKNIIIGQSGGPTAVINSSLAGVYKAARSLGADTVYGMKYGIEGLLKEELLELNVLLDDRMSVGSLKRTPSSYLSRPISSCRTRRRIPPRSSNCLPCLTNTTSARCSTLAATTPWTPLQSFPATEPRWAAASGSSGSPRPSTTTSA